MRARQQAGTVTDIGEGEGVQRMEACLGGPVCRSRCRLAA